ncbi:hypothetical protein Ancab_034784 [Ancistrocladus abbreviatus]
MTSGFDNSQAIKCTYAVIVPVYRSAFPHNEEPDQNVTITAVRQALLNGFELEWYADNEFCDDCHGKLGDCGHNLDENKPVCYYPEEEEDRWFWKYAKNGRYSVKEAYEVCINGDRGDIRVKQVDIWDKTVLGNILAYAWRWLLNKLPTKGNLGKYGVIRQGD